MRGIEILAVDFKQAGNAAAYLAGGVVAAYVLYFILLKVLDGISRKSKIIQDGAFSRHCKKAILWTLIALSVRFVLTLLELGERANELISHAITLLLIVFVSWLIISLINVFQESIYSHFNIQVQDNLRARKIRTQLNVFRRILVVIVVVLAFGTILMTFDKVRQLGTTILASAGVIGIVMGIAAQRTIGTFIAGLQIAFTQPIRVDDVVIVENEWGRIEEITLTYVVVKIWDLRRLVVPITYFIEKPFQNWTRVTADLLGTVYLYVDYRVPVEKVRDQLKRILEGCEEWDGKVSVLQVTNTTEHAVELRALVSARDASQAWTLRCKVREKLLDFIKREYPESLPRVRAELENLPEEISKKTD